MKLCLLPPAGEKLSAALAVALAAAGLTGAASHASRLYLPQLLAGEAPPALGALLATLTAFFALEAGW